MLCSSWCILSDVAVGRLFKLASRQWNRHDANSKYLFCWAIELPAWSIVLIALSIQKPIVPVDVYRAVRDSQLIGLSGYSREVCTIYSSKWLKLGFGSETYFLFRSFKILLRVRATWSIYLKVVKTTKRGTMKET